MPHYLHFDRARFCRETEYFALADVEGPDPGTGLTEELAALQLEITELLRHAHRWDADGMCEVCGADGNA